MTGQIGKPRDFSYEVSYLMVIHLEVPKAGAAGSWDSKPVVFSQPANALGGCIEVNVVTRKGGKMVVTLTWQKRTLGVDDEE